MLRLSEYIGFLLIAALTLFWGRCNSVWFDFWGENIDLRCNTVSCHFPTLSGSVIGLIPQQLVSLLTVQGFFIFEKTAEIRLLKYFWYFYAKLQSSFITFTTFSPVTSHLNSFFLPSWVALAVCVEPYAAYIRWLIALPRDHFSWLMALGERWDFHLTFFTLLSQLHAQ